MWETPYVNGKRHGVSKCFYKSGDLETESTYVNGKKHGVDKCYSESGNLWRTTEYKNGLIVSK